MTLARPRNLARPAFGLLALAAAVLLTSVNVFAAVGDIAPTVTTQPADQSVTAGADATMISAASATPTPTIQWQVSTGGGPFADVAGATSTTLTVANTTVAMSGNTYRAVFTNAAGSALSNAATLTVNKASPTITTVTVSPANLGDRISDTATLSGGSSPTGAFDFTLYRDDPTCSGVGVFTSIITTVNGNGSYQSDLYTLPAPGTYTWVVFYGGDSNNNPVTTVCNGPSETVVVSRAITFITTSATTSAVTTGTMIDTATLSGGYLPTGTITFALFGPDNATCAVQPAFTSTTPVLSGNGSYPSDVFSPVLAGTYHWVAAYSGDGSNSAVTTSCNDSGEKTTVTKMSTTLSTFATASAQLGGIIGDVATLSGGNLPTGMISFSLFGPNNATCSGTPVFTSSKAVSGIGRYLSDSFSPLAPGDYRWVASYNGDANNYPSGTSCDDFNETSTVSKASPTITTQATASTNVGDPISDTAILAGGLAPTGTITFSLFGPNNATCLGTAPFTSTTAVSGDGSYLSDPATPTLAGAYRWVASYSGDVSNKATSTACNDANETSTVTLPVTKFSPTLTTSATPSANVGATISDTAILAGGNAATGVITFTVFGPNSVACAGTPVFTSTPAVNGDGSYLSGSFSPLLPGSYSWVAAYGGDSANNAATAACSDPGETSMVAKASPTITTRATPSAAAGGAIFDTATLAGGSLPTGTITFGLFGPNDASCSGTPIFTSATAVGGNGGYSSDPFSPAVAGAFGWVASYSGDVSNNATSTACNDANETSTVTKATPTITTSATPSANVGGAASDTATVAGGSQPTGTITFSLFGPNNTTCSWPALFTSTKPVSGAGSYPSDAFVAALPGTYSWVASYSGDAGNDAISTACNDAVETTTVTKASPTITTQATVSANAGGPISDTAILAGGAAPTGTITFSLFDPNNSTCAGTALFTSTKAVSGDGSYPSDPFSATSAGTYSWMASYGGDANNNAASTACNDAGETSTVSNSTPTLTTQATASANMGGAISDTAILAGGSAPTGTITFTLFGPNNATCLGIPAFTSTKAISGNGSYGSDPFSPSVPGTYSWVASYSGDAGNNAATTACNDAGETSTVTAVSTQDLKLSMFKVGDFQSGGVGAFIVIVTNTGATDTSGTLTFTDVLPAGLTFVDSFTFDGWICSAAGQTVTCTYAKSLPALDITALALFVRVTAANETVLTNTATITPSDATPDDNTASLTVTVSSGDEEDFWSYDNHKSHASNGPDRQSQMDSE